MELRSFFDPEKDEVKGEGLFSTIFNYDGLVSFVQLKNGEFGFYYPDSNRLHDRTFKNAYYCLNNLALIEKDGKFHYYNLEDGHVFEGEFDHFLDASIEKLLNKHPEEYNHLPLALFMEALNNGNLQKYHNYIEDGLNELDSNCEPGDKAVFEAYKNLVHKMVEAKDRKAMQRWEEDKAAEEAEEAEMDE